MPAPIGAAWPLAMSCSAQLSQIAPVTRSPVGACETKGMAPGRLWQVAQGGSWGIRGLP
jgi:hypothetical protein